MIDMLFNEAGVLGLVKIQLKHFVRQAYGINEYMVLFIIVAPYKIFF